MRWIWKAFDFVLSSIFIGLAALFCLETIINLSRWIGSSSSSVGSDTASFIELMFFLFTVGVTMRATYTMIKYRKEICAWLNSPI